MLGAPPPDRLDHIAFMREALAEALKAEAAGEVPVGAVVVSGSAIVGRGYNQPIASGDPTAHAEVVAIREASRTLGNYRLMGTRLYVTVEPCLMCVGAIVHARVGTLIYGASEPKAGAVVSGLAALNHPSLNHHVEVVGGVLADQSRAVIQRFFQTRRSQAHDLAAGGPIKERRPPRAPPTSAERYRSGRNGAASKAACRVIPGTWVRIPPSPPT